MPTRTHTPKKKARAAVRSVQTPCRRVGCDNPATPGDAAYPFCSGTCAAATKAKETLEIKYTIEIEPDDTDVRGNALASGDDAVDKEAEDAILARLATGDTWAWCVVKITASAAINGIDTGFDGAAYLGGCSYEGDEDFKNGGYYEDLCAQAKDDLIKNLNKAIVQGQIAEKAERMMLDQLLMTLSKG